MVALTRRVLILPVIDTKKFQMPVSQTLDSIQASADWLKRDKEDILEWLKANKYL